MPMLWKHVLTAVGLGLCLFQVFTITESYLEFNVISKVSLKEAKNVTLPGLTVCSYLCYFWSKEVIQQYADRIPQLRRTDLHSFLLTPEGQTTMKEFISTLTVSEIRSSVEKSAEHLIRIHFLPNRETGLVINDPSHDFIIQSFLLEGNLCRMIYPKNPKLYTYSIRSFRGNQFGNSMVLYIVGGSSTNSTSQNMALITLTPPGKLPSGPSSSFELITQDQHRYAYAIKYKISKAERMPPPYITNCKNYTEDGLESEEELYQKCLNEIASRTWSSTAPGTLVPLSSAGHLKYENVPRVGEEGKQWKEALNYCAKKASQQSCKSEHYSITSVARMKMLTNESIISILVPYEPTVVTMDIPMMTTLDFIVSIGSTFGYWMGFNVVAASISSVLYCQKYGSFVKEKLKCKCKPVEGISIKPGVAGFNGRKPMKI